MASDGLEIDRRLGGRQFLLALGILLLATWLRWAGLGKDGVLSYDEGQMIREGRACRDLMGATWEVWRGSRGAATRLAELLEWSPICFARPIHNLALALLGIFAPSDVAAAQWLSAAAGVAGVAMTLLLGRRWFGTAVGFGAAALLAVSPYHVVYSRSSLADAWAVLWWIVAMWSWGREGNGMQFMAGVAAGICVGSSYRLLPFLLVAPLSVLISRRDAKLRSLGELWSWLAGGIGVLLLMEGPPRIWQILADSSGRHVRSEAGGYLAQLAGLALWHAHTGLSFSGWWAFAFWIVSFDGPLPACVSALALFSLARDSSMEGRKAFWCVSAPWMMFAFLSVSGPRLFTVVLPALAIVNARFLIHVGERRAKGNRGWISYMPLTAVCVLLLARAARDVPQPTPYADAEALLKQAGAVVHLSTNRNIGEAYGGPASCWPIPADQVELDTFRAAGVRFVVIDLQRQFGGYGLPNERETMTRWIESHGRLVNEIPYSPRAVFRLVSEQVYPFPVIRRMLAGIDNARPALRIYDLGPLR